MIDKKLMAAANMSYFCNKKGNVSTKDCIQNRANETYKQIKNSFLNTEKASINRKYNTDYRFYERNVKNDKYKDIERIRRDGLEKRKKKVIDGIQKKIRHYQEVVLLYQELLMAKMTYFEHKNKELDMYLKRAERVKKLWQNRYGKNLIKRSK